MTTDSRDGNLEPPSPIFPGLTPKHFLSTEETSPSGKLRQLPSKSGRRVSSMFLVYPNPASKDRQREEGGGKRAGSDPHEFFPQLLRAITPNRSILDSTDDFFARGKERKKKGKERKGEKGSELNKHSLALASGKKERGKKIGGIASGRETWLENQENRPGREKGEGRRSKFH